VPFLLVSKSYGKQYFSEVHRLAVADVQNRHYWNNFDDGSVSYWQVTFVADVAEAAAVPDCVIGSRF
jgi:hypothetical protein